MLARSPGGSPCGPSIPNCRSAISRGAINKRWFVGGDGWKAGSRLLVLEEPTFGRSTVGSKAEIYQILREALSRGSRSAARLPPTSKIGFAGHIPPRR